MEKTRDITLESMTIEKIKSLGGDGLICLYEDCACGVDDLMPCLNAKPDCQVARKIKCAACGEGDFWPLNATIDGFCCYTCDFEEAEEAEAEEQ